MNGKIKTVGKTPREKRFQIQREMDNEPTYVTPGNDTADEESVVIGYRIPREKAEKIARFALKLLNANP